MVSIIKTLITLKTHYFNQNDFKIKSEFYKDTKKILWYHFQLF